MARPVQYPFAPTICFVLVGVFVHEDGCGVFRENEVLGAASVAVQVVKGGQPLLQRNYINGPWYKAVEV